MALSQKDPSSLYQTLKVLIRGGILVVLLSPAFVDRDLFFPFSSSKGFLFLAAVQFTCAFWLLLGLLNRDYRPRCNAVSLALLALLLCTILSTLVSQDVNRGVWSTYERMSGLVFQVHLYVFFLILSSFLKDKRDWICFFTASAIIATLVGAMSLFDRFGFIGAVAALSGSDDFLSGVTASAEAGSTFGNTSFMGAYLQINAFFSLYLFLHGNGKRKAGAAFLLSVISAALLVSPGGRAVKATYLFGLAVVFLTKIMVKSISLRKFTLLAVFASLPVAIILSLLVSFTGDFLLSDALQVRGVAARAINWKAAAQGFIEKPILGWGLENYDLMFYQKFDPAILVGAGRTMGDPWFDRAHNIVFDILVTTGLLGLVAYFAGVMAASITLRKQMLQLGPGFLNEYLVFSVLILIHFLQNLTVFESSSSSVLLYAVFAFTSNHGPSYDLFRCREGRFTPSRNTSFIIWACTIPLLVLIYWKCVHAPKVVGKVVGNLEWVGNDRDIFDELKMISNGASVGRHQVRYRLAELAVSRLKNARGKEEGILRLREVDYVLDELKKSALVSPSNLRIAFTEGRLSAAASVWAYERLGDEGAPNAIALKYVERAIAAYRRALEICNNHVLSYLELSRALVYKGYISDDSQFFREALVVAERAVEWEPRLFESHDLAIDISASLLNDRPGALQKVEVGAGIDPTWRRKLLKRVNEAE